MMNEGEGTEEEDGKEGTTKRARTRTRRTGRRVDDWEERNGWWQHGGSRPVLAVRSGL